MPQNQHLKDLTSNSAFLKMMLKIFISWLLIAGLLFVGAGRMDWNLGWSFFITWGMLKLVFMLILRWHDPDLLVERATRHENTQQYDRIILPVYFLLSFSTIAIDGIDAGRFQRSGPISITVIVIAYIIYLLGNMLASWAVTANPFFSSESRLQADRGQIVTRSGPYQYVRHPAYLASILLWPVTGPMLGSWWAVFPGCLAAFMMFIRTVYEDRMLQAELSGYSDYMQDVPYRLFPGIW
jgi:protein-S-isoprenylcysteine O-methyltransferase Ste14